VSVLDSPESYALKQLDERIRLLVSSRTSPHWFYEPMVEGGPGSTVSDYLTAPRVSGLFISQGARTQVGLALRCELSCHERARYGCTVHIGLLPLT
jgi:hypothetical protein